MVNLPAPMEKRIPTVSADNFLRQLLLEQQQLTAVGEFSSWHEQQTMDHAAHYRALLPTSSPKSGEQLAFEVDLDTCSGCKACVTACHNLNGLEEAETWRHVGMLLGISDASRPQQYVTTACHHCVEPGCLQGCPVQAYDKDPLTGIVRHLDDQCIGCQYCILMCPYEVPQYSAAKGIVRKCDMCRQRLEAGDAPACVAGCPNQAIRITIVSQQTARQRAQTSTFLAASPDPSLTIPTTIYRSAKLQNVADIQGELAGIVAANDTLPHIAHPHFPLVAMLVLTQMSVGTLLLERILFAAAAIDARASLALLLVSAATGLVGGNAAALHLGKPFGAWRAWMGLRTSWLSREIVTLGPYGGLLGLAALLALLSFTTLASWLSSLALCVGIVGVISSAMIYIATGRDYWNASRTFPRFLGSTLGLGLAVATVVILASHTQPTLVALLALASLMVASVQAFSLNESRRRRQQYPSRSLERTALLLRNALSDAFQMQMSAIVCGGFLGPMILLLIATSSQENAMQQTPVFPIAVVNTVTLLLGNLLERMLYFQACTPAKMPGDDR